VVQPAAAAAPAAIVAPSPAPATPADDAANKPDAPSVDLEIYFGFASAEITPAAAATLVTLGRTLADPRLAGQTFVIGGFTDGKGKPDYNLRLSQMRADAVRTLLIRQFDIAPERLIAKGFGQAKLKNARDPKADENRRVRIINWTDKMGVAP
jgi:outer membrane protein OmpA-like peptidoglycan-associated protein